MHQPRQFVTQPIFHRPGSPQELLESGLPNRWYLVARSSDVADRPVGIRRAGPKSRSLAWQRRWADTLLRIIARIAVRLCRSEKSSATTWCVRITEFTSQEKARSRKSRQHRIAHW